MKKLSRKGLQSLGWEDSQGQQKTEWDNKAGFPSS